MSNIIKDARYSISSIYKRNHRYYCLVNDSLNTGTFELNPSLILKEKPNILLDFNLNDKIKIISLASHAANIVIFPEKGLQFKFYFLILILFSSILLTSNIAAIKLISIFGITLTGGFIVYPFTFVFGSIAVEVYGYKNARQAIWAGFILNLVFVFFIDIVAFLPPSPYWHLNEAFKTIMLPETRIVFASLCSFLFDDFINGYLLSKLKISYCGEYFFKRIVLSSGCAIFIGSSIFITLAFAGTIPEYALLKLVLVACAKKTLCQIILFPLTYSLVNYLKRKEGIEIFDYGTKFNPFSLDTYYTKECFKKLTNC